MRIDSPGRIDSGPVPDSILFVCLGNICRSPTAEGVFRHMLARDAPRLDVRVDSAGTGDYHVGEPPDLRTQHAALRRGIDLQSLRARQVTADDFSRFRLILAMDRDNLGVLRARRPAASTAELGLFLEYAGGTGNLEVPDPYFGGEAGFEQVLDLVTAASLELIEKLRAAG